MAGNILLFNTGLLNQIHIRCSGAIADGRLVGVHFNNGVVYTHAGQGRENVLYGVYLNGAYGQCSGALYRLHVGGRGINERFVRQVDTTELKAGVRFGRLNGQAYGQPRVEGSAFN